MSDDFLASNDMSEDNILIVESRGLIQCDVELRGGFGRGAAVGHSKFKGLTVMVFEVVVFVVAVPD